MTPTHHRTHGAGELREEHVGQTVTLAGWVARRRDHGGVAFLDLRDASGVVQVVLHDAVAHDLRAEYCVQVVGTVQKRPAGNENAELATGAVEVPVDSLTVLTPAAPLPFQLDDEVGEEARLKHRYLDLRRSAPSSAMRLRSEVNHAARSVLHDKGFVEVETPTLTRSTPEGARDFLVPARLKPGSWCALPQSPQLFKQLLMVGGLERYYQIARCYRDEDFRADRQPEFTQLDIEMSFVDQDDVIALAEDVLVAVWDLIGHRVETPIRRMTYAEAMRRFGTDKPDLRYGMELVDFTNAVRGTDFIVFKNAVESGGSIEGLCVPGGAAFSRKEIDALTEAVKQLGAKGLVSIAFSAAPADAAEEQIKSPVLKHIGLDLVRSIGKIAGADAGDLVLIVAGQGGVASKEPGAAARVKPALDALRRNLAAKLELADPNTLGFAFIIDVPLVEWNDDEERWDAVHHLFTSPVPEDIGLMDSDPGAVRSNAYDITCNGWEIGSGSIRIHQRNVQEQVFRLLGIGEEDQRVKFGHMLEAFEFGAPPHGGFAPGMDRTAAIFAQESDIREVIAFPKTKSASDLMTGAPTPVDASALEQVGLQLKVSGP
jgi:aspartyl-tRNA synthetase